MHAEVEARFSKHAKRRSAQSNLCEHDVELVCRYGVLEHRTGVRFYFMRRREVEKYRAAEPRLERLQGLVMIISNDNIVITTYRNSRALRDIRRKSKFQSSAAA
jgi:hypothetical protein